MNPPPSPDLLVVAAIRSFRNAAAARAWALLHVRGRSAKKRSTRVSIRIGRRAIEKTTSQSAVRKSGNAAAHFAAVSVLISLLEEAVLVESRPDRDADPNVRQIHRFYAALRFRDQLFRAKLTVKEFAQAAEGTGFYAYELAQIEIPAWNQAASCPEGQTSAPQAGTINLTELLKGASASLG